MTTRADFPFKRGETIKITASFKKPDETELPIGPSTLVQFRLAKSGVLYFLLNKADMVVEGDGSTGVISAVLTDTMQDTAGIPSRGRFRYEFWYTDPVFGDSDQVEGVIKLSSSLKKTLPTL